MFTDVLNKTVSHKSPSSTNLIIIFNLKAIILISNNKIIIAFKNTIMRIKTDCEYIYVKADVINNSRILLPRQHRGGLITHN